MLSQIQALLPSHPWVDRIHYFPTIDSTNTYAKGLAAQGAPEGTVVLADQQTGGRGRLGRSFASPAGMGIYLSVILRPNCPPQRTDAFNLRRRSCRQRCCGRRHRPCARHKMDQ